MTAAADEVQASSSLSVAARTCTVDGEEVEDVERIGVGAKTRRNLEEEKREEDDDDNKCQHVTRTYIIRKCYAQKKGHLFSYTSPLFVSPFLSLSLSSSTFVQYSTNDYKSYSSRFDWEDATKWMSKHLEVLSTTNSLYIGTKTKAVTSSHYSPCTSETIDSFRWRID